MRFHFFLFLSYYHLNYSNMKINEMFISILHPWYQTWCYIVFESSLFLSPSLFYIDGCHHHMHHQYLFPFFIPDIKHGVTLFSSLHCSYYLHYFILMAPTITCTTNSINNFWRAFVDRAVIRIKTISQRNYFIATM